MNYQQYDKSLYVLDNHCHISFPQRVEETLRDYEALVAKLAISEAGFLSCPVSSHNETGMDVLENMKTLYIKDTMNIPVFAYAGFTEHWADPEKYRDFANIMIDMGFDGFKSLEEHPKDRRDIGKGLPHPSFSGFFEVLNEKKLPIVCHVGDPRPNWAEETAYAGVKELGRLYGDDFMSLDELYAEMEEIIAKYPDIQFVLAHFYFISDNYDRAVELMETYPNVNFDICPGGEMFVNFTQDIERWREFFIRYRKRIIMGSDHYAEGYGIYRYNLARTFLEGSEPVEHQDSPVQPIGLPTDVLEDIYVGNAKRLTGAEPKSVDRKKAYAYCCYVRDNLMDQLTEMGKANLKTIMEHFKD